MPTSPPDAAASSSPARDFGPRSFILFGLGSGISFSGTWAQRTAFGWLAWDLTHSVAWVGALALADLIAALWVAPFAGTVTDRSHPGRLLYVTEGASMLLALALCALTAADTLSIHGLMLFALAAAALRGFSQPAQMLLPGLLAPEERLSQAVATSAVTIALACAVGPAVAGLVMHLTGSVAPVFAFNALTYLVLFAALFHLRRQLHRPPPRHRAAFLAELCEGIAHVAGNPALTGVFVVTLGFSFLARPFAELLPAFAGEVFGGGPGTLSLLMSAQGIGAVVGAVVMLRCQRRAALLRILYGASFGIVLALLAFVSADTLERALPAIAAAGFCHVVCNIAMQSLCQLDSTAALRGRVIALYGMLFRVGPTVGAFCIAQAESLFPLGTLVGVCALAYALMVGVMSLRQRTVQDETLVTEEHPR
ncbi:MAG: MFS transporter [Zoogloeaceae bacterium]|jgi:predicted MFS family arabinose efflux permease|nr:MFS transporter [Zoogloeaceae bacterium]